MAIDWAPLIDLVVISFGALAVIVLFALGVRLLAHQSGVSDPPGGSRESLRKAAAGLCFLACLVVVAYGLYRFVT